MGMSTQPHWGGSGFIPFSTPEPLPADAQGLKGMFVTEWATGVTHEENRQCPRHSIQQELLITDPDWWETENQLPIHGECLNVSEEGLYALVPGGYRLAVGQRYQFQLRPRTGSEKQVSQLGTIVRTEIVLGHGQDRLGIGVRLAGPIT